MTARYSRRVQSRSNPGKTESRGPKNRSWKAMILAAGLGTRLKPYTDHRPKALFPIDGRPMLNRIIGQLVDAGCGGVMINTHHLYHQIEAFISSGKYPIPVLTRYEPEILGTGGGIKNAADFFDRQPFLVLNCDIITDIPLGAVYAFHCSHADPVTLVLCDDPGINTVGVTADFKVTGFGQAPPKVDADAIFWRTFTGIQVLDPIIFDYIPGGRFFSIIDAYRRIISKGDVVRAFIADQYHWRDIGTPEAYRDEVIRKIVPRAFERAFGDARGRDIHRTHLAGDGSDRSWYRLTSGRHSLVMVDHGLRLGEGVSESDAFIDIGRHLHRQRVPVPRLIAWDRFAGLVLMEDLGDIDLQALVRDTSADRLETVYRHVIAQWIRLAVNGNDGFDPDWAWQTRRYDRRLVIEKEGGYFIDAFLNGYLGRTEDTATYLSEFSHLADRIMAHAIDGLIHRDCQSRNIMVKKGRFYFIDFQGARPGPVQYDLASLLIDPYVELPADLQTRLCDYAFRRLNRVKPTDRRRFYTGYRYCALARNLQILGAFGFLVRKKKKSWFEAYISAAVRSLGRCLDCFHRDEFPALRSISDDIEKKLVIPQTFRSRL